MPRIDRSPEAQADIDQIVDYIARDSEVASHRWLDSLNKEFDLLSQFPRMGRQRDDLAPELRSLPFGNYVIFYYPLHDGILVARVFHGAREVDAEFQ
jgi:toxin ParE1/3/4